MSIASHDTVAPNARDTLQFNRKLPADFCSLQDLLPYKQPAEEFAILEHVSLSQLTHITTYQSRGICPAGLADYSVCEPFSRKCFEHPRVGQRKGGPPCTV